MSNNRNSKTITAMTQYIYGTKMMMDIPLDRIDNYLLGNIVRDFPLGKGEKIDRTIVKIPGTKNAVMIYNKYQNEDSKKDFDESMARWEAEGRKQSEPRPGVSMPSLNLNLYGKVIFCRMDEDGTLHSIDKEDFEHFIDCIYDPWKEQQKRRQAEAEASEFVPEQKDSISEPKSVEDLQAWDFVVCRDGSVGIVFKEEETILFREGGTSDFCEYNDDFTYSDRDDNGGDIMKIYRCGQITGFHAYEEDGCLIFDRKE